MLAYLRRAKLKLSLLAGALCLIMLTGCQATQQKDLKSFLSQAHTPVGSSEYRVMPPDILRISARPTEEYIELEVPVGPDGKANLPLVGEFQLADKTATQISAELAERLKDYYQDVQVTARVVGYNSQRFYVFGQVSRPGAYPYTGNDSLLSALAAAQPTTLAMPERIQLTRGSTPNQGGFLPANDAGPDDAHKLTINLYDMIRKGDMSANVLLARNDVIYVPPNPLAAVGLAIQNLMFPVRPAIETARSPGEFAMAPASGGAQ